MTLKFQQQFKQSQQLIMTPQMTTAIQMLALPQIELISFINKELLENPVLEEDFSKYKRSPEINSHFEYDLEHIPNKNSNLQDHLQWQLGMHYLLQEEQIFALHIIYNLNDKGFLEIEWEELWKYSGLEEEDAREVLYLIQGLEPLGCATWSIQESLLVQAKALPLHLQNKKAILLLEHYFSQLQNKDYSSLLSEEIFSPKEISEAENHIKTLHPYPGKLFSQSEAEFIVPDLYIYEEKGKFLVSNNREGIPQLKLGPYYQDLHLKNVEQRSTTLNYIDEKLKMGEWLIKTINYRQNTLLKVAKAILEFQDDFFSKGEAYLKPMLLKDIAPLLGVNISTICRACMGKYVQTPRGLFELKYFFSAKGKEETNADHIKKMILELISKEDPRYPFSDQQLLQILQKKGIQVARRTLAKYRELMNIPTSSQRKNSRNS